MLDFTKRVVVIGCGGIGSWLLAPLLRFLVANGFKGQIVFCDGDKYSDRNMARQDFPANAVNHNKADVQKLIYSAAYPQLTIVSFSEYVIQSNIKTVVREGDLVFTAVDNHPARVLVDKRAAELDNICVITAGNDMYDGNAHAYVRLDGSNVTESFLDRHPETAAVKEGDRTGTGCEELISDGNTQLLLTNFVAASAALQIFHSLWIYGSKDGNRQIRHLPQEIFFDISANKMLPVEVSA